MRCPACDFENPPGMQFCGQCGSSHGISTAAVEERKIVTVLFADVVESTRLASKVDPEQLRAQMARFFEIARAEILRYGGTVEKFIGDAVMVVFGLPVVHEDDPERAARAAAAIRARVNAKTDSGTLPQVRIGIYTGEVIANPQAAAQGEFLVTGETVNLAARLQQHAEPGQILIGERTMQTLRRAARLHPVAPLTVKGVETPLLAWELVEVPRTVEREVRPTPFVGREEDLDLLQGYLRRMRRDGRGYLITILGPAGVGKTRLAQEFRACAGDIHVLRGRALPYGTGVPFWPWAERSATSAESFLATPWRPPAGNWPIPPRGWKSRLIPVHDVIDFFSMEKSTLTAPRCSRAKSANGTMAATIRPALASSAAV